MSLARVKRPSHNQDCHHLALRAVHINVPFYDDGDMCSLYKGIIWWRRRVSPRPHTYPPDNRMCFGSLFANGACMCVCAITAKCGDIFMVTELYFFEF